MKTVALVAIAVVFIVGGIFLVRDDGSQSQFEQNDEQQSTEEKKGRIKIAPTPTPTPTSIPIKKVKDPREKESDFHAGIAVLLYGTDYSGMDELNRKLNRLFDRLISLEINSLSLNWPVFQDGLHGTEFWKHNEKTPSTNAIKLFITKAKERNFTVNLRPIIDEENIEGTGEWRGTIEPADIDDWFGNYQELLLEYAQLGEQTNADIFTIGAELVSMEKYTDRWREFIENARNKFSGQLTYSVNRNIENGMPWNDLDFISMDAFFQLNAPIGSSPQKIRQEWSQIVQRQIERAQALNKPLVISEMGTTSQRGSWQYSWRWDHGTPISLEAQRKFYKASCDAWKPYIDGIYWWAANIWSPPNPEEDATFTPLNKPAEEEIKECYD